MRNRLIILSFIAALVLIGGASLSQAGIAYWTQVTSLGTTLDVTHLASPNRDSSLVLAAADQSLYRSTDRGGGWTKIFDTTSAAGFTGIAYSPNFGSDRKVLVTSGDQLMRSTDAGQSFIQIASPPETTLAANFMAVAFSPNYAADNTIFAGTSQGLFYSVNEGGWTQLPPFGGAIAVNSIAVSPNYGTDRLIWLGTDVGFYRVRNYAPPASSLLLGGGIASVTLMSPDFMFGAIHEIVAATDVGLVLIKNAQSSYPTLINLSMADSNGNYYFPLNAYGAPTFDEMNISAFDSFKTPRSTLGIDIFVATGGGVYKLAKVGSVGPSARPITGGAEGLDIQALQSLRIGDYGYTILAGARYKGVFSYLDDLTPPTAWLTNVPALSTDVSKDQSFIINWTGVDALSPITLYEIQYRIGGTVPWRTWLTTGATGGTFRGAQGGSYYFKVRARDAAGNWSSYSQYGTPAAVPFDDRNLRLIAGGTWSNLSGVTGRYMRTLKRTKARGSNVRLKFIGKKIVVIGDKGPKQGKVAFWVDGVKKATFDNWAGSSKRRQKLFTFTWSAEKQRTVKLVNKATRGRPYFSLDAIAVVRK